MLRTLMLSSNLVPAETSFPHANLRTPYSLIPLVDVGHDVAFASLHKVVRALVHAARRIEPELDRHLIEDHGEAGLQGHENGLERLDR